MKNLDHNCSVDNNILESVGVPADSTAESELLSSCRVLHMQRTLLNIQRDGLNTSTTCYNLPASLSIISWQLTLGATGH